MQANRHFLSARVIGLIVAAIMSGVIHAGALATGEDAPSGGVGGSGLGVLAITPLSVAWFVSIKPRQATQRPDESA